MKKRELKLINGQLGELEREIMEVAWQSDRVSVREVLGQLKKKRQIAYTTVMTVMSRLYNKGLLRRNCRDEAAYCYWPAQSKKEFFASVSKRTINSLLKSFGEVAVAQFIDAVGSSDAKNLAQWREKLKEISVPHQ